MSMKTTEINIILLWYYFKKILNFFFTSLCHASDWTIRVIRLNSTRVSSQKFKFKIFFSIVSFGIKSRNFKYIWSLTGVDCNLLLKFLPCSIYLCFSIWILAFEKISNVDMNAIFHTNLHVQACMYIWFGEINFYIFFDVRVS